MSVFSGGVNYSIPGNGGPDCVSYISFGQKTIETVLCCLIFGSQVWATREQCFGELPKAFLSKTYNSKTKKLTLGFLSAIFAVELLYKTLSRTLIYALNPCHIVTILQIFLLMTSHDNWVSCVVFRVHLYMLSGATLALVFPVLNTRLLPGEVLLYYIQHVVILAIPLYLFSLEGAYTPEMLYELAWSRFAVGILFLYHFIPLQFLGNWNQVNLNNMICPAVSDPFRGRFWRVAAAFHQSVYIPIHTKLYSVIAQTLVGVYKRGITGRKAAGSIRKLSIENGDLLWRKMKKTSEFEQNGVAAAHLFVNSAKLD